MNLEHQIVDALRNDNQLRFKKETNGKLWGGTCPDCSKTEVFISVEKPYQLKCNRSNNCGYVESTRARYSELWSNLADKFPASATDPSATAKAYMSMVRGFPLIKTESWFEQGAMRLKNGNLAETVRFPLWDGYWWDRLINERDIRNNTKNGESPNKADFKYGTKYKDKCWVPPTQTIEQGDHIYIVEGIFHAIAFSLSGYKVAAAFSSSNLPRELIHANKGKNITWCLAYDAGNAGEYASLKFLKEINGLKEAARICLPHSEKIDWDDLYRDEKITEKYLEDSKWRGRMLAAASHKEKAFMLYCWRPYHHTIITFNKQTYAVSVSSAELTKALEGEAINYKEHPQLFMRFTTIELVLNCELHSLHSEVDKFTKEIKYIFNALTKENKNGEILDFTASNIAERKSFALSLLSKMAWREFTGSAGDFTLLKQSWSATRNITVETIPVIGYDETVKAYVFPEVGYKNGKCIKVNSHGYLDFKDFGIKTTLKNVKFMHGEIFDTNILSDFIKVFDMNGFAALAYWTATLFVRQIKERHKSFPFLELTGEPQAGKTTLINFLWKLLGRDNYEGVDLLSNSSSSEGRLLSQLSNLPLVALESDREPDLNKNKGGRPTKAVDWDSFKKIYDLDGVLMTRGVKTNDNQVSESIFRGAFVITQNASVQGSDAIMSRINHLHCTTAHKKIENREIADRLKAMPVDQLSGYMHQALCKESEFLQEFFAAFDTHRHTLTKTTNIKNTRIIDNHAQHMAAAQALTVIFPNLSKSVLNQVFNHLISRAQERERRLSADHPLVQQFWDAYHHINDQTMLLIDESGEQEVDDQKLNHSINPLHIAVNLNEFIEHARLRGQGFFDIEDLKKVLPSSRHYPFVGQKPVNSRKKKGTARCFVFINPQTG